MIQTENSVKLLFLALMCLVLVVPAAALISYMRNVSTTGIVASVEIGVYTDSGLSTVLTGIDWGVMYPASSSTYVCWVKYSGNVNATLTVIAVNWAPPSASSTILFKAPSQIVLKPGDVVEVNMQLLVLENVSVKSFSFNIEFTATG